MGLEKADIGGVKMTKIMAHRGASGLYPENTILAFEKAAEMGADAIETDVHLSKDGKLVICHDESVLRTTGFDGLVCEMTYSELSKLDAGFLKGHPGQRLPLLEDLLRIAAENDIGVNIELKNNVFAYAGMEEKVIAALYDYGLEKRCILSSFNHRSMHRAKEIDPKIPVGLLYSCDLYEAQQYAKSCGADALHPQYASVNAGMVQRAQEAGVAVNVWTVNTCKVIDDMLFAGVDNIITNYPDLVRERMR